MYPVGAASPSSTRGGIANSSCVSPRGTNPLLREPSPPSVGLRSWGTDAGPPRGEPGSGRAVPHPGSSAPGPGRPGRAGPAGRSTAGSGRGAVRSRSASAISSATRRCGGRAVGRAGRSGRRRKRPREAVRVTSVRVISVWVTSVWVVSVWASPSDTPCDTAGSSSAAASRPRSAGPRVGRPASDRSASATGSRTRRGIPCGTVSRPSGTTVMVVGASTRAAGRARGGGGVGTRSAGARGTGTRSGIAIGPGRERCSGTVSGSTVRTGYGERPRTTTVPRSITRRAASSSRAEPVGPVATPYSIQRGPSTPTNSDDASPVRACSSRPHSPVNDRTVAPPSRSDSSISAARSGHSPPVRGAASALTESRPAGSITCTACRRPSSGSTDTSPPRGTGTRTAPKSTRSVAACSGSRSSSSKGPSVTGPSPPAPSLSPRPAPRATNRLRASAPIVRAPGSSPGSSRPFTEPFTADGRPPGVGFVRADPPRPRRAITGVLRKAARARRWSRSHRPLARTRAGPGPRRT